MKEIQMATKYRLNVDPDVEHELSDAEVQDLRAFGFEVTPVNGRGKSGSGQGPADEKKEG